MGKNIEEAEKILKENNLEIKIKTDQEEIDKKNTIVKNQTPQPGIMVNENSIVTVEI